MDGPGYLESLRNGWRTLVVGALLGAALAGVLVLLATPTYTTNERFFISTASTDTAASAYEGNLFSQQRVTSYAELITDQQLTAAVIEELHLDMTPQQLAAELSASVVPNTVILDVTVSDTSPTRAVQIAESIARQFDDIVTALETPAGATEPAVSVHVIAAPQRPDAASSPKPVQNLVVGVLLGLLAGAAVVLVRTRLDTRVRDVERAATDLGAPSLGVVLRDGELERDKVLGALSMTPAAESLRQVRTSLDFLDVDAPPRVITITSSVQSEGKSTLATNLAVQLAEEGRRVVLVDADTRRPRASRYLGVPGGAGLTNVLNGSVDLSEVLQDVGETGRLRVLAAGPTVPNPGNLLSSGRMRELLATLLEDADMVLLDAPPVLPVADTSRLAPLSDGVVFCARWGGATRTQLQQSRRSMARVGARTLGVVITFMPRSAATANGYGYGYGTDDESGRRGWLGRLRSGIGSAPRSSLPAWAAERKSGDVPPTAVEDEPMAGASAR